MAGPFLTARWRHLVMLNWTVDRDVLAARVPTGTVLDAHDGHHYVSLVAFLFLDTRVLGVPVPFHRDFEEVNLRFYVRRDVPDEERGVPMRRGVVFIKEIVPRIAIAALARLAYNENYESAPMRHAFSCEGETVDSAGDLSSGTRLAYGWEVPSKPPTWAEAHAEIVGHPQPLEPGGHAEFIAEHYWGYAKQRDGGTVEYQVEHPPWRVWEVANAGLVCDVEAIYGAEFAEVLGGPPVSAFVAEGSEVSVMRGVHLKRA